MLIKLKNVRLAPFPNLFDAKSFQGEGEKTYSSSFILEKNAIVYNEEGEKIKLSDALTDVAKEKWKDKHLAVLKDLGIKDKLCLHDGDNKSEYDGYAGMDYLSAKRKEKDKRPVVIDTDKSPLSASDGKPYGGCYVNANIEIWPQDNQFGKRINATLLGVQFVKDGEAFSATPAGSADDFEEVDSADTDGLV